MVGSGCLGAQHLWTEWQVRDSATKITIGWINLILPLASDQNDLPLCSTNFVIFLDHLWEGCSETVLILDLVNAGQFDLENTGCIQNEWTTGGLNWSENRCLLLLLLLIPILRLQWWMSSTEWHPRLAFPGVKSGTFPSMTRSSSLNRLTRKPLYVNPEIIRNNPTNHPSVTPN